MDEKTVVITGCSSGIGRATARAFLDDGWQVYATARDSTDINDLGEAGCETVALDVTDDGQIREVVSTIVDESGAIRCLVNNAGYGQHGPLEDVEVDLLHRQFDVNVYGPHRLTRAVLPHMRTAGDGTIVNVSSAAALLTAPGMGAYSASKHALEAMSDALRREVDGFGVDVVLIEPGPVATPFRERVSHEMNRLARTEAYESLYRFQEDSFLFGAESPFAIPPEDVAGVIVEAACSQDPAPRYPVGHVARLVRLARFLPDGLRDTVFRLVLKVTA